MTMKESPKPMNQPSGVRRESAMDAILSVTEENVWPGPITGGLVSSVTRTSSCGWSCGSESLYITLSLLQFGVGVAHVTQIGRARLRVQLVEHRVVSLIALEPGHPAVGNVHVTEYDCVRGTGGGAGGHDFAVADPPVLLLRFDPRLADSLNAVGALLHN